MSYSDLRTKTLSESLNIQKRWVQTVTLASGLPKETESDWARMYNAPLAGAFTGYYKNPGWEDRLRKGLQAGTPASGTYETYVTSPAKVKWVIPNRLGGGYGGYCEKTWYATGISPYRTLGGSAASYSEANNLALKRVFSRIDSLTSGLKALVSAGEAAETVRMLRAPSQTLFDELWRYIDDCKVNVKRLRRKLPRNRRHAITRVTAVLSGLWLERQLGWKPLINDIEGAFDALAKVSQRPYEKEHFVVRAQGDSVGVGQRSLTSLVGLQADAQVRWRREQRISVRYIVGVSLDPNVSTFGAVQDAFGLHWSEFVPTVWELIPYSFVVDYFTNIGDIVGAFSTRQRHIAWVIKTTQTEGVNTIEEVIPLPWGISSGYANTATVHRRPRGVYRKGSFARELLPGLDIPSLEINGLADVKSLQKLNMLALLRSSRSVESLIRASLPK